MEKTNQGISMTQQTLSPLSLIAIFAGIIEASALASLPFLSESSQTTYTWFLVGFPFFLTVLFFLTLNFNAGSLFTPEKCASTAVPPLDPGATPSTTPHPALLDPPRTDDTPIIIALSGPQSRSAIEQHILSVVGGQHAAARSWVLHDLDNRSTVHLTVAPLNDAIGTPFNPP